MKFHALALGAALALGGCSTAWYQESRQEVIDEVARFNDAAIDNALLVICRAGAIDAIRREFGTSPERAAAYDVICLDDPGTVPLLSGPARAPAPTPIVPQPLPGDPT